jgi:hypothetical protein
MKQKSKEKPKEQEPSKPKHDELEGLRQQIESLQAEKEEIFGKLQRHCCRPWIILSIRCKTPARLKMLTSWSRAFK